METRDLAYYCGCFERLSVNKKGGQLAPHKPLLLLAIMDLVETGIIKAPHIELSEALVTAFKLNELRYARNIKHFKPNIGMPYYHMGNEPFWRLVPKDPNNTPSKYAVSTLRAAYDYAVIDTELFMLMKNPDACRQLREVLINNYLTNRNGTSLQSLSPIVVIASCLMQLIA